MDVLRLAAADVRLLRARCDEHGNSHRRMAAALVEVGQRDAAERLRGLRSIERRFAVDLGSLCLRFGRRGDEATHPLERAILDWVAELRPAAEDAGELWVFLDRLRQIRGLIEEGELVGELD